jgi:hypothetical protein
MNILLCAIVFFGSLAGCFAAPDYAKCISNLAKGTPKETLESSLQTLRDAGAAAFPALILQLTNQADADPNYFQEQKMDRSPDGSFHPHAPTIGEVCFGIVQTQVEGHWPKSFRQYYVLSPRKAKSWVEAHQGLTLPQLRRAARQESLRRAEADRAAKPAEQSLKQVVAFLREEIENGKK